MTAQNPYNKYVDIAVNTASKERLTLMLYEGALKFANQAIIALDADDAMKLNEAVKRAMDIIWELQLTLKREHEISNDMYALYDYMKQRLVDGNSNRDRASLEEARDLLKEFRDTWKEAMALGNKQ